MSNSRRSPTPAEDIAAQSQKIIAQLRQDKAELEQTIQDQQQTIDGQQEIVTGQRQRITVLEELRQEYEQLRSMFASNGNLTYNQAYQVILTQRNAEVKRQSDIISAERRAKQEATEAAKRDELVKQILDENPSWQTNADERKAKVKATKDNTLNLAARFYDMTTEEARLYIDIPHKIRESAVSALLIEKTHTDQLGQKQFDGYECDFCGDTSYNLDEFERHCYLNQENHKDANLEQIENEARQDIAKISKELTKDIEDAIQAKADAQYKARLAKERAEQTRIKKNLPYVTK
jgi:hypothetical protein